MENSEPRRLKPLFFLVAMILVGMSCSGEFPRISRRAVLRLEWVPEINADTVLYRYQFGGETITHYLDGVQSLTVYQRSGAERYDQVVFNLKDGRDIVLNEDLLDEYKIFPGSTVKKVLELNKLYHHYDPYLQGYKQDLHQAWVDDQYLSETRRLPTEGEWLEALNELSRGVEHHQMERWIKYSPPAIKYYLESHLERLLGRPPSDEEQEHLYKLILSGMEYEELEISLRE